MQISTIGFGPPLAILFSSYFILPILFPLKLTSINEYIELRFQEQKTEICHIFPDDCEYFSQWWNYLVRPDSCTFSHYKDEHLNLHLNTRNSLYTIFILCKRKFLKMIVLLNQGGIRAVVWTDVFQLLVMTIGLVAVMAVGCAQNGGFFETLNIASEGGRLEVFNMSLSPFVRHTFFNTIVQGFFLSLRGYCSDQVYIQRICAVKTFENARNVLKFNMIGKFAMSCLIFFCGLVIYATYAGCDPMTLGKIKKKDEIITYYVMDKLSLIPGLPGLFVATIIGAALRISNAPCLRLSTPAWLCCGKTLA
ncbi:hypothetical protein Avbf_12694 [Armadillidium vulgare]|nr:hypothetical protein Avbf_12694 [Armadillidium vulgare]